MASASARSYAQAAFDTAQVEGALEDWKSLLRSLVVLMNDPMAQTAMSSPELGSAWLGHQLTDTYSSAWSSTQSRWVNVLAEHRRWKELPKIEEEFLRLEAEAKGVLQVRVESARPLSDDLQQRLMDKIKRRWGVAQLQVEWLCVPELLAGAVVRVGDQALDGSLYGRLQQLAQQLSQQG